MAIRCSRIGRHDLPLVLHQASTKLENPVGLFRRTDDSLSAKNRVHNCLRNRALGQGLLLRPKHIVIRDSQHGQGAHIGIDRCHQQWLEVALWDNRHALFPFHCLLDFAIRKAQDLVDILQAVRVAAQR